MATLDTLRCRILRGASLIALLAALSVTPVHAQATDDAATDDAVTEDAAATTTEDAAAEAEPEDAEADDGGADAEDTEPLYTDEELDDLVAPIALYPDALLTQVFVASTYPLDVIKADRWIEGNAELADDARAEAAQGEGWDPSVAVLAAGFPTVVDRMAENIDWTESLGDALLAQSDDVLEATQRMRARAAAAGNLESNEAQTVEVSDDEIAIEPATPDVVYVPTYDTQTVYTSAPPTTVVVEEDDDDNSDLIVTGLLAFGAGMLVNEIFDDDDDWDDYWRPGYRPVGWGNGNFYPRPGFNNNDIDINIDRDNNLNIGKDGAWKPDDRRKRQAKDKISDRKGVTTGRKPGNRDKIAAKPSSRDNLKNKLGAGSEKRPAIGKTKDSKPLKKKATKQSSFSGKNKKLGDAKKAGNRGTVSKNKAAKKPVKAKAPKRAQAGGAPKLKKAPNRNKGGAFSKKSGGAKKAGGAQARGGKSMAKRKRG